MTFPRLPHLRPPSAWGLRKESVEGFSGFRFLEMQDRSSGHILVSHYQKAWHALRAFPRRDAVLARSDLASHTGKECPREGSKPRPEKNSQVLKEGGVCSLCQSCSSCNRFYMAPFREGVPTTWRYKWSTLLVPFTLPGTILDSPVQDYINSHGILYSD